MKIALLAAAACCAGLAPAETLGINFTLGSSPLYNAPGGESDSFVSFNPTISGNTFSFTGTINSSYTGYIAYNFGVVDPSSGEMLDTITLTFSNSCPAILSACEGARPSCAFSNAT